MSHISEALEKRILEVYGHDSHSAGDQALIDILCLVIDQCTGVPIVLDGFDECEKKAQSNALSLFFHRLLKLSKPVIEILITY